MTLGQQEEFKGIIPVHLGCSGLREVEKDDLVTFFGLLKEGPSILEENADPGGGQGGLILISQKNPG